MSAHRSLSSGDRRSRKPLWIVAFILITIAAGFYMVWGGHFSSRASDPELPHSLRQELSTALADLKEARDELEVQRTRHAVDRRALELVRLEMAAQKEYTTDLEEDLRFYKSLMTPEGVEVGLSAQPPELVALDGPGRFAYRIVIVQATSKHELVKGVLSLTVNGFLGEEEVSYPLTELVADSEDEELQLQFRYFQSVEGDFTLPDGFEPTSMTVEFSANKPRKLEFREQFPWQL